MLIKVVGYFIDNVDELERGVALGSKFKLIWPNFFEVFSCSLCRNRFSKILLMELKREICLWLDEILTGFPGLRNFIIDTCFQIEGKYSNLIHE